VTEDGLLDHMFGELAQGRGGWLVTANLDHLHRYRRDPALRTLYARASLIVADGMPLVWASRVKGEALPERVAGSALITRFAERAALEGRSLYLLGGDPGAAEACGRVLCQRAPGLRIVGHAAPRVDVPPSDAQVADVLAELRRAAPDLLLVGMGSPKQEWLIDRLRDALPHTWMVGVGISFSFVAGEVARAPKWMQATGLEWVHRLAQEPRRLAKRYLLDDLPFAATLFAHAAAARLRGRPDA
jgi:N-acetylglucosaminyldiphosphoundecaprenol N-acetyl-beta-D-mannosaminyltransferase